jgi:hypothetical protein
LTTRSAKRRGGKIIKGHTVLQGVPQGSLSWPQVAEVLYLRDHLHAAAPDSTSTRRKLTPVKVPPLPPRFDENAWELDDPFPEAPLRQAGNAIYANDLPRLFEATSNLLCLRIRGEDHDQLLMRPVLLIAQKLADIKNYERALHYGKMILRQSLTEDEVATGRSFLDRCIAQMEADLNEQGEPQERPDPTQTAELLAFMADAQKATTAEPRYVVREAMPEHTSRYEKLIEIGHKALAHNQPALAADIVRTLIEKPSALKETLLLALSIAEKTNHHGKTDLSLEMTDLAKRCATERSFVDLGIHASKLTDWINGTIWGKSYKNTRAPARPAHLFEPDPAYTEYLVPTLSERRHEAVRTFLRTFTDVRLTEPTQG